MNRYATAAEVAEVAVTRDGITTDTVVLASGEVFADALAGAGLAGLNDASVLLSLQDRLPAETEQGLADLNPTNVIILGGTNAIDQGVEDELEADGYNVTRVAGVDRFETAADIATAIGTAPDVNGLATAVLANGLRFPDALAIGPSAHELSLPVLLTTAADLNADAEAAITSLNVEQVVILGGTDVVSQDIEDGLEADGVTVIRLAGPTRYETAAEVAQFHLDELGFDTTWGFVASGEKFPDALASAPLAAGFDGPLLLSMENSVPEATTDFFTTNCFDNIELIGGTAALDESVNDTLQALAGNCETTNQAFAVTPGLTLTEAGTVTQFSISGITTNLVDIALVDCANIDTTDGVTTFQNSSNPGGTGNVANLTGVDSGITIGVVNGAAVSAAQYKSDVAVNNGTVTFSTTNNGADCFVAVVFNDANNDNQINLGTNNQPTEAFGNSGDINVVPPEAADNSVIDATVLQNSALANLFIGTFPDEAGSGGARTYYYDTNDEFLLEAGVVDTVLTIDEFEARLSPGDLVDGTYRSDPANQSRFILTDRAPFAPANVVAKTPDGTTNAGKAGIEVEFIDSTTASVVKYDIFRATATQPTITGQDVTCPTIASGAYTDIADVADKTGNTSSGATYEYVDSTATVAPAATPTNPSYCYYVVSVDRAGDSGPASNIAGPQAATAGDTSGAPEFIGTGNSFSGTTVTVNYDEAIKPTSIDADASNYDVTVTRNGVTTALTEVSTTDVDADTVTITVSGIPGGTFQAGDTVVVTAKVGLDGNTVLDLADVAQPVGNAVQVTASADSMAPTFVSAVETGADQITVTYSEAVKACGVDPANLDEAQFVFNDGTTNFTPTSAVADSDTTFVLTFALVSPIDSTNNTSEGTLAYTDGTAGPDAGDVCDLAGNPSANVAATATSDPA